DRSRGFQIEERAPSDARDGSPRKYYFVMPDPSGHLRLVASDMAEVGREAMRQLDQHRPEAAAHLVEGGVQMLGSILRRIKEAGSKDLSLEERVFRLKVLWPAGAPPHRDPEAVRTAAAALAGPRFRTLAVPVLERAFARVTGSVRDAVGEELMAEAQADRRWSTVVELAGKLSEEARATRVVHEFLLAALGKLGRADEVEAIAADWRRRWPDELLVERLLVQHDVDEGRLAPAIARLERLLIRPEAEGVDHNNLAWYLFVLGGDRARAIDAARKAVNGRRDLNRVNTLACLLADAGQVDEAIRLAHEQQAAATGRATGAQLPPRAGGREDG
ncbi:MAG TPA: hypothetical protein VN914_11750, partial [Polyangia bacterium]|nr:hypothetical protein [Polyangia bacterium]